MANVRLRPKAHMGIIATAVQRGKVRDLHRMAWIEVPELELDLELEVRRAGCKVHHAEASKRTPS